MSCGSRVCPPARPDDPGQVRIEKEDCAIVHGGLGAEVAPGTPSVVGAQDASATVARAGAIQRVDRILFQERFMRGSPKQWLGGFAQHCSRPG